MLTGIEHTLELPITPEQMLAYEQGALVQDAFPTLGQPTGNSSSPGSRPRSGRRACRYHKMSHPRRRAAFPTNLVGQRASCTWRKAH